jgi:hypothetical protein
MSKTKRTMSVGEKFELVGGVKVSQQTRDRQTKEIADNILKAGGPHGSDTTTVRLQVRTRPCV